LKIHPTAMGEGEKVTIRKATVADIDLLVRLRFAYLEADGGTIADADRKALEKQLPDYFSKHLADGGFIGIIAEMDGTAVSTAFLAISEKPANPAFITGKTGTLLNVLTVPAYRRKGIATKVIGRLMDEAKLAGVATVDLLATEDGEPLYRKNGFTESTYTYMRKKL